MTTDKAGLFEQRASERDAAVGALNHALLAIEAAGGSVDAWEGACLQRGIHALIQGLYGLALTQAKLAGKPPSERRSEPVGAGSAENGPYEIAELRRSLNAATMEPVHLYRSPGRTG